MSSMRSGQAAQTVARQAATADRRGNPTTRPGSLGQGRRPHRRRPPTGVGLRGRGNTGSQCRQERGDGGFCPA